MDKHLSTNEDFANKELVFELTHQILKSADNPAEASETLASQLRELTGAKIIAIYTFDNARELQLNFVSPDRRKDLVITQDSLALVKQTCKKKESSLFDTDFNSENYEPRLKKLGLEISLGLPLWLGKQNLGCIMVLNLPSKHKINLVQDSLQSLSNILALVLRNAFLFEQQQHLLESSEAQMEALVNAREESIWSVNKDFCYLTFNTFFKRAYEAAYNHTLKVGENALDLLSNEQKDFWLEQYEKVLKGEKVVFKFDEVIFDQTLYFEVHLNPIYIDGEILGISAISSDITDRKNAELKLLESETRFKSIFENMGVGVGLLNLKGEFIQVNDGMTKISGYSSEELLMMTNADISHPEDLPKTRENLMLLMQGKISWFNQHKRLIHKNGSIIWVDLNLNPIYSTEGKIIHLTGVMKDITTEKAMSKSLADSEQKYRLLANHTFDWEYWLDVNGKYKYVSPSCEQISGYTPNDFYQNSELIHQLVHPSDKEKTLAHYKKERKNSQELQHINFRIINKKGQEIWIAHSCISIIDTEGNYLGIRGVNRDITERRKAEESSRYFSQLFEESVNEIYILDAKDYRFIQANQSAFKNIGYSLDELKQKTAIDIKPEISSAKFIEIIEPLEKGITDKIIFETLHQRKDKSTYPVEVHLQKSTFENQDVIVAMILDTSDKKEAESRLHILSSAVNQASVIVVITDPKGEIKFANPFFSEVTGYSFEEAVGANPRILQSGHTSPEEYKEIWNKINSGQNWRGEFLNKKKNGELFWEDATITPIIDENGIIKHFVAIKEVITDKKEMLNELVVAKEKAEESDKLKTEFLTNMSHEIRTPMNGIVGFGDLLSDPDAQYEDRQQYIGVIQNSSHQLLKIIDDILEISRLETKQVKAIETEVNINNVCKQLYEVFHLKNKHRPIEFQLDCEQEGTEAVILTDEIKLKKILSNLLENAFKFTTEGEITFGYNRSKEGQLEFFVKDTGIGIHPSAFTGIFDRFSQEEKEISQKAGGLGLGLSIAKENAELLGGKMRIESEKGIGATFFLCIPLQAVQENSKIEIIDEQPLTTSNKHTILIAEDEAINFEYLKILLEKIGPNFNILHAWDGQEAVEMCKNNPEINLVFMDIKMPKLNGYEATKQIRALRPNLPILAQTAYSTPDEITKALSAGCNEFMSKPLNKNKIYKFIQRFLSIVL